MVDGVNQRHQFPGTLDIAHLGERHHRPYRPVSVLTAVFPHTGQVTPDVARIRAIAVKGWGQQFDDAGLVVYQVLIQRLHCLCAAIFVTRAGKDRPTLGYGINAAFCRLV
ncbi:hypothetical protein D3C75_660530 [compost metagenome]